MSETQLEINFSPADGNRLRASLESGKFSIFIETQVPQGEMDRQSGIKRLETLEKTVLALPDTALAIVDNCSRQNLRAIEFAAALPPENRDRHLVYLSGTGLTIREVDELLQMAENAGLHNIVPVSGDAPERIRSAKECRKIPFTESIDSLKLIAEKSGKFYAGTTINPFQYTPGTTLASYYKLAKKFNSGASFMVTQTGWDMLKLQSIAWYLTGRNMFYPKIARLTLLSPEKAENIIAGNVPGVKVSDDLKILLNEELTFSRPQFETMQFRRLELQAAGCRLFGFSGIQISGADNPARTAYIVERIKAAISEYENFDHWLEEYNSFMASCEMAPFNRNFQLYDRMLYRNYPFDTPPETRELPPPEISWLEKAAFYCKSFLFCHADRQRADNARFLKSLMAGCPGCDACHLPKKNFVCSLNCPMLLRNGICGSVNPDGSCPFSDLECVHHQILRLAHWRNRLPEQENIIL